MNNEPHIKIIPSNPFTNSILVAHCYINGQLAHCSMQWNNLQSPLRQTIKSDSNINDVKYLPLSQQLQSTVAYKCTPLDYGNCIKVSGMCEYNGKQIKLICYSEPVRVHPQLIDKKQRIQWVLGRISNSALTMSVECRIIIGDPSNILKLIIGAKTFNLKLNCNHIKIVSNQAFKVSIQTDKYDFLMFLTGYRLNEKSKFMSSVFQFQFYSDIDRDLVLLQLSSDNKGNQLCREDSNPQSSTRISKALSLIDDKAEVNSRKPKYTANRSFNDNPISKNTTRFLNKNDSTFKTPQVKKTQTQDNNHLKINQKIKISEQLMKKSDTKIQQLKRQNTNKKGINTPPNFQERTYNECIQLTPINTENQDLYENQRKQEFLNIFNQQVQEEHIRVEGLDILKQSALSHDVVRSTSNYEQRPCTTNNKPETPQNKQNLPSMNLRGSFQQLERSWVSNQNPKKQLKVDIQIKKDKNYRFNRQLNNQYSQKEIKQQNKELLCINKMNQQSLKTQNFQLKKRLSAFQKLERQNNNLKKKYFQLNEEMNRLQIEKKDILSDKLKWQASYQKEKFEKQKLKTQLQMIKGQTGSLSIKQDEINSLQKNILKTKYFETFKPITTDYLNLKKLKTFDRNQNKILNKTSQKINSQNSSNNIQQFGFNCSKYKQSTQFNSQSSKQLKFPNYGSKYPKGNTNIF